METELTTTFDYSQIDGNTSQRLQSLAEKGRMHVRRTKEELLALHDVLWEAKALLPHGAWMPWLRSELNIGQSGAWKIMHPKVVEDEVNDIVLEYHEPQQITGPQQSQEQEVPYEQLSVEQRVKELEPFAQQLFGLILAIGKALYQAKQDCLQNKPEQWGKWLQHTRGLTIPQASLFITVYEASLMHPDKTPGELLPAILRPMEAIAGYFLLGIKRLFFAQECSADEWPVKNDQPESEDPAVLGQWVCDNHLEWPLQAFRIIEIQKNHS